MSDVAGLLNRALDRRAILHLGAMAGLGAAVMPRLALAAADPYILPSVRAVIERWTGPGKFPGMVASLGLPGKAPVYAMRGTEGFNDGDEVSPDSLFRIYSMTKPVTGMAAMQLIEEGRLGLDQPLHDVIPAYRDMQVLDTYDGPLGETHPAPRAITMRHLMTHTSGLGYSIVQKGPIAEAYKARGLVPGQVSRIEIPGVSFGRSVEGLDRFANGLADLPLVADPGTRWSYSMGLDVMGRVIEVVSGQPFDVFLKERIFDPAGMTSTFFTVPEAEQGRLTTNYAAIENVLVPIDPPETSIYLDEPPFPFGGAGLVSSPRDYDRFLRLLAQFGAIGGTRILGEAAVRAGTRDLMPNGAKFVDFDGREQGFGAGGRVGKGAEAGIFGWSGAAGTVGMVDMARGLRSQLFVQFMPPDANTLLPEFQTALKADVMALFDKG